MTDTTIKFVREKETKGAVRYQEVDAEGKPAEAWAKVGTLYVRKTAFERGQIPETINVTMSW